MQLDFIGYTGKTGSIIYNNLKDKYDFKNLVNSKNYKEYIINVDNNTTVIDFSSKGFIFDFLEKNKDRKFKDFFYITGVTGFSREEFDKIDEHFRNINIVGLHFPNFSLGINLMNDFVKKIGLYFSNAEIIEMHHQTKKDKPSGTSLMTSKIICNTWRNNNVSNEVAIHSVRLPSLVAHQTVIFSNEYGEVLEITHHSLNRLCFSFGVQKVLDKILYEFKNGNYELNFKCGLQFNINLLDFLEK
ncbi:MAG: hypothetical protein N2169_02700 [bacterium]|nr:hypothetical protein [bacterium]